MRSRGRLAIRIEWSCHDHCEDIGRERNHLGVNLGLITAHTEGIVNSAISNISDLGKNV